MENIMSSKLLTTRRGTIILGIGAAVLAAIVLLVYLNQYRRNANVTGEKVDQDRVLLTLVRAGRDCKVSRAAAI